jgi:anti-sigma B factor antagonist
MDGLAVVTPPTEITIQNTEQLREALAAAGEDHTVIVVDMTANEFCDSSGISELVMAQKRARAATGEVRLVMTDPAVRRIFKVTDVDGIFRIFDSLDNAVAADPAAGAPGTAPPSAHR